jgi:hypothetical protein
MRVQGIVAAGSGRVGGGEGGVEKSGGGGATDLQLLAVASLMSKAAKQTKTCQGVGKCLGEQQRH